MGVLPEASTMRGRAKKDLKKNQKKVAREEISITFAAPFERKERAEETRGNKKKEDRVSERS